MQSPTYPIHSYGVVIAGANLRSIPLCENLDNFLVDIESAINDGMKKPKMIIINLKNFLSTIFSQIIFDLTMLFAFKNLDDQPNINS